MKEPGLRFLRPLVLAAVASLAIACSRSPDYAPGLGELMSFQQMRHAKLWFAGQAENWPLAAYELDEIREGFDDVVKFHPTHKDSPLPLSALVPKIVDEPLRELDRAVAAHDQKAFTKAFDTLTAGCNSCHWATNFSFNVVQRPTAPGYSNQDFTPRPPAP
jgi:hypothetical protein